MNANSSFHALFHAPCLDIDVRGNYIAVFVVMALLLNAFSFRVTAQVDLRFQLPPPGSLNPEDLAELVSFNNPVSDVLHVLMTATLEEETRGLVFQATTSVFEIPPGVSAPHYHVYEPISLDYRDRALERYVAQTNTLPPGEYVVCARLIHVETEMEIGFNCTPFSVFQPSAPVLVYPAEGTAVLEPSPVFTWLPPSPPPPIDVLYRLKLVEVHNEQTPYEAMESNPAFFQEDHITGTNLVYPPDAALLPDGKLFAWQVQALIGEGFPLGENNGYSEIVVFVSGSPAMMEIISVAPLAACVSDVTEGVNTSVTTFQWFAQEGFQSFEVIIYTNACGRFPDPPPPPGTPGPTPVPTPTPTPVPTPTPTPVPTPVPTPTPTPVPTPTPTPTPTPVPTPVPTPTPTPVPTPVPTPTPTPVPTPVSGPTDDPVPADQPGVGDDSLTPPADSGEIPDDWPDEGETPLPPLPPGWEWGPAGPTWNGKHPPEPPDLPPGWEWGPLRPVWTGMGSQPPERKIIGFSEPVPAQVSQTGQTGIAVEKQVFYQFSFDLGPLLKPGQAFIYQIYGIFSEPGGSTIGYLSQPQCLRYNFSPVADLTPVPVPCDPCELYVEKKVGPAMDGGLDPQKEDITIKRDEFVTLKAVGADFDELWWHCNPLPDCPESYSTEMRPLNGRVRFEWNITEGEGNFVELGCSGKSSFKEGNRVIFMPPYVSIDKEKNTTIELKVIDDNPSQPLDKTVTKKITIKTKRTRGKPDDYEISINSDDYKLPVPSQYTMLANGTCKARGPKWDMDNDLKTPDIILPGVEDKDKVVYKELIRLHASRIGDPDEYEVWCVSSCPTFKKKEVLQDNVEYIWTDKSGLGKFIKGNVGRYVVYEAPETAGEVEIEVQVYNPDPLKIVDKRPEPASVKLNVYQPGVRMDTTAIAWLPKHDNELSKRSYLVYEDQKIWKPALAHQCRIHFFEMMDVSTEPGICLNWPSADSADACLDLSIRKLNDYEVYDSIECQRWKRTGTKYYRAARTKEPEKEFTITVKSEDYGSYGFIRSLANGSKSTTSPYKSVEWKQEEKTHPMGRKKYLEYTDNRVTIPRDIDENRIADGGWQTSMQRLVSAFLGSTMKEADPANPRQDSDSIPKSNIPENQGDGISAYEEYRGFYVKGVHQRFSTSGKDLLIWDRNNIGLGYFRKTRITCWLINQNEFDRSRVININRKTHNLGFDQKGIRLLRNESAKMNGKYGWAVRSISADGLVTCDSVLINVALNNLHHRDLSRCIAHELSHAVGVRHHGEGIIRGTLNPGDDVMEDGAWKTNDGALIYRMPIACNGGLTSGDTNCWMRYVNYISHCPESAELKAITCPAGNQAADLAYLSISSITDHVFGTEICNSLNGTGVNAGNNCGQNASVGNCIILIRISCNR